MKTLNIASTFTNISELYIAEAADMPYATAVIPAEKRKNGFVRFINSGWGVAMLCALVAIAVTVGILAAGHAAGPVTTLPGAGPTHPTFAFDYELDPDQDDYQRCDTITVKTEVKNLGMPFTVTGSSQAFSADAWLVPHGSEDVYAAEGRINGLFAYTEDYVVQTIDQGEVGKHSGLITIPESAFLGAYDLVLAYKGEYQVFEKAVKVVRIRETPPQEDGVTLHFSPNLSKAEYACGETVTIDFSVRGIDPFGSDPYIHNTGNAELQSYYTLSAVLTRHGKGTDDASAIVGKIQPDLQANMLSSNTTWRFYGATFEIPENALGGSYDLYLCYVSTKEGDDTVKEVLVENVLTVKSTHSRFDFHYSISPYTSTFLPGNSYEITTFVTNMGEPFTITGSSKEFSSEAKLVHHDDPEKVIYAHFSYPEDVVTQEITTGKKGQHRGFFTIPADAATGEYDLWLSYGEEYQVFEKALSVEDPTVLPLLQNINFSDHGIFERLQGFSLLNFRHRWGEPDNVLEESEYFWEIPRDHDYVIVTFSADGLSENIAYTNVMKATVTEHQGNGLTVQPYEGEIELNSADAFDVSLANTPQNVKDAIEVGTVIYVSYTGFINETYPCHFQHQGAVTLRPPARPYITDEEAEAIANAYMKNVSIAVPLAEMNVQISEREESEYYYISYTYLLGGFPTSYKFSMEVGYDGIIRNYKPCKWDPEVYYAIYTDEEVRATVDRIRQKVSADLGDTDLPNYSGRLKEQDGKLYISVEYILDCNHEDGKECLLGHHHYSYEEEVIKIE